MTANTYMYMYMYKLSAKSQKVLKPAEHRYKDVNNRKIHFVSKHELLVTYGRPLL